MLSDYVGWQNINHPSYILIILQQYLGYVNDIGVCTRGFKPPYTQQDNSWPLNVM
jgi:hypothetical protein